MHCTEERQDMLDVTQDTAPVISAKTDPVPHTLTTTKFTKQLDIDGWRITTIKRPISNAKEIEALQASIEIPVPEMIFGGNGVHIDHEKLNLHISWTAEAALDAVDKTGTSLKVAYSDHWNKTRDQHSEDIKHVTKPYDWTYTTPFAGTCQQHGWQTTTKQMPIALLKRQDPILLYDEVVLFEDELADNGTSLLSVRVRVMPERLLVLARFFMRLDDVLFRVRDTRLFCELKDATVLREYVEREAPFGEVKKQIPPYRQDEAGTLLDDANWVLECCPVVSRRIEELKLSFHSQINT